MAVIETKFSIGDTVWNASTTTETRQFPCPDCKDSRTWKATSPAGEEYPVPCPRCSTSYQSNDALNLKYTAFAPYVRRLTVGQVRASVGGSSWGEDRGHEYMCAETGIGSGTIYYESTLFETEEQALAVAEAKAKVANLDKTSHYGKLYDKRAEFCDYTLKDASIEAADSRARQMAYKFSYLVDDLAEAETISEVRRIIDRWREESLEDRAARQAEEATATEAEPAQ